MRAHYARIPVRCSRRRHQHLQSNWIEKGGIIIRLLKKNQDFFLILERLSLYFYSLGDIDFSLRFLLAGFLGDGLRRLGRRDRTGTQGRFVKYQAKYW
jgi:hypothetical protein